MFDPAKEHQMSWNPALDPTIPIGDAVDRIETVIVPRARDLGGFEVRRALPSVARQMVGPFIFFDQMGPAEFLTGQGIDVRPHPHIGLATVTYLLRGRIHHRDSLGTDQWIEPGAVNWMLAGQGITHSERMDGEMLAKPHSLFGLQTWIALPKDREDDRAAFVHSPETDLPVLEGEGKSVRLILGSVWGETAPIETPSEMFYADATLEAGASIPLPDNHEDRGVYILAGDVTVGGETYLAGRMLVFRPGDRISVKAGDAGARIMLLGGATMDGPRHIWWNFVASSQDRINAAKEAWRAGDWAHGRFRLPPADDKEFIPAPEQ
jgi:redox-sensitive bicupin YhaK (pirin superfamily)